jgi:cytochrome c2
MRRLIPLLALGALAACSGNGDRYAEAKRLIGANCVTCHTVPGIPGANGTIGPSLAGVAHRALLAGRFPNTPATMARWIQHPQAMLPGTAMPEMGLTPEQTRAIADYLYTLDDEK